MDTWTHEDKDTGYASDFNCAHWIGEGVDLHLVGGNGGQIQTSPDGTNWTSRTAGAPIFGSIEGFAHAPDILGSPRILTVGGNGSTEECATSDDGIAWSAQAFAGVAGAASGCTWNNSDNGGSGQFVVGFFDGTIQWSDDGVNWNNEGVQFGDIRAITNNNQAGDGNSIYVAVGVAGSIIRSVNGQDVWTDETPGGGYAGNFWGVCWSEAQSLFMAVGGLSMMQTSPDGINWTDRSADIPAVGSGNNVYGCDYSVNLDEWVITGSGEYIATHPADVTSGVWTQRTVGEPTNTASPNILAVHVQDAPVAIGVGTLAEIQRADAAPPATPGPVAGDIVGGTTIGADINFAGYVEPDPRLKGAFKALLPRGAAWTRVIGTTWDKLICAMVSEPTRAALRIGEHTPGGLFSEMFFPTMVELLPDWERIAGLPDPCAPAPVTIADRQAALVARILARGGDGTNVALLLELANALGYPDAEIRRFHLRPFDVDSFCNDALYDMQLPGNAPEGGGWEYVYEVILPHTDGNTQGANAVCQIIRSAMAHLAITFAFPLVTSASLTHARSSTAVMYLPEDLQQIALASDEAGVIYYGHHEDT